MSRRAALRRRAARPRMTGRLASWLTTHRRSVVLGAAAAAVVLGVGLGVGLTRGSANPAVTTVGGPSGNQLHQLNGGNPAPFIGIADFYPIWQRHDPQYLLVDVREAGERANSRISDDLWVPLADMQTTGWQYLQQHAAGRIIVLYCDCPYQEAANASVILKSHGFTDAQLKVLHEGIPGWSHAGYPTATNSIDPCVGQSWPQACGA